jgi:tetratricopeptide (TPR) repeat protein
MFSKKILVVIGCLAFAAACTSIEKRTFESNKKLYVQSARAAVNSGDWENARRRYFLALQNAQWSEAKPEELARLNLQVGRASGVTCKYDAAEKHLNKSYDLDKKADAPTYLALIELARLSLAQSKTLEAVGFFERAMPELETVKLAKKDPIGYAELLEEYAKALSVSGNTSRAKSIAARASEMRAANQGKVGIYAETPYGKQCTT